jgi:hypothetical protein
VLVVIGVFAVVGGAWAYFTSVGAGTGAASVGSLPAPTNVTGVQSGSTVTVSWTGVADSGPENFGYYVTRTPVPSGATVDVCGSSPTSLLPRTPTTCNDNSVSSGTYTYTVTAVYSSFSSNASGQVTVTGPPTASVPGITAAITYSSNPMWVNRENVALTDGPSANGGPAVTSVSYYYCTVSAAPCTSANWTSIGMSSTSVGSWPVTWSSTSLPADGTYDVVATATNSALLTSPVSSSIEVGIDTTGPVISAPTIAAAVTYGSNPTYVSNENVTLTDNSVVDAGSGVMSLAYYYCAGSSGSCSTTPIGSSSTSSGSYSVTWSSPLPLDGPYRIEAVATDNVTDATTSASTLVDVDATPPTVSTPIVNGQP